MPPARDRAALVDAISNSNLPPRPRQHAAQELLLKFPAVTRTIDELMGLFPRPVSPDTFEICCAARDHARARRQEFRVVGSKTKREDQ